jgi:hypothetical protein
MTCRHVKVGGSPAIVCSRGRQARRRCGCGRPATLLCDYPVPHGEVRKVSTCDAPICRKCAASVGPDLDYCPKHQERA